MVSTRSKLEQHSYCCTQLHYASRSIPGLSSQSSDHQLPTRLHHRMYYLEAVSIRPCRALEGDVCETYANVNVCVNANVNVNVNV